MYMSKFKYAFLSIFLIFVILQQVIGENSVPPNTPESVPGKSIANHDKQFMQNMYGILYGTSKEKFNCKFPEVIEAKITKFSPWDTTKNPPELTGEIIEQWNVNMCGKFIGMFFGIVPAEGVPGGIQIQAAYGELEQNKQSGIDSQITNEYKKLIIGKWGNSKDGGNTFWSYDEYSNEGEIHSYGEIPGANLKFDIVSSYEIDGRISCATVNKTSHPDVMPIGSKTCSEIRDINQNKMILKHDDGELSILYRINE